MNPWDKIKGWGWPWQGLEPRQQVLCIFGLFLWIPFFWNFDAICGLLDRKHGYVFFSVILGLLVILTIVSFVEILRGKLQRRASEAEPDLPANGHKDYLGPEEARNETKSAAKLGGD